MNTSDEATREQLSAWMDGELPAEAARFLERRLANDAQLRRHFERLQLASACLKGQAWRLMPMPLASAISGAVEQPATIPMPSRNRTLVGWAVAATVAVLALLVLPVSLRVLAPAHVGDVAMVQAPLPNMVASPSSADLVAAPTAAAVVLTPASRREPHIPVQTSSLLAIAGQAVRQESPLPLESQSPADFPLAEANLQKTWPRSPLATSGDPALEAYLVRHNQMLANDGLGGFMPYVDVVARDEERTDIQGTDEAGQ